MYASFRIINLFFSKRRLNIRLKLKHVMSCITIISFKYVNSFELFRTSDIIMRTYNYARTSLYLCFGASV